MRGRRFANRNRIGLFLAVVIVIGFLWFGKAYGSQFLSRVRPNIALGFYNSVVEFFVPQIVYASDGIASGPGDDIYSALVPSLSYYSKVLRYESMEQENYEALVVLENTRAAGLQEDNSSELPDTEDGDGVLDDGEGNEAAWQAGEDEMREIAAMADAAENAKTEKDESSKTEADEGSTTESNGNGGAGTNDDSAVTVLANLSKQVVIDRDKLSDFDYLKSAFYQVDSTTTISSDQLDVSQLLGKDMTLEETEGGEPQILIYHTHSQEGYADSVEGDSSTTVVGVGEYLTQILTEQYGYSVLHHMGEYDVGDRDHAYTNAAPALEELLLEYPSIQVIIDLHRDGVSESTHLVTEINGKQTAQIMFFNGISRTTTLGDISWLPNPYIEDNLAFSFQLQLAAAEYYPGFTRKIYIKGYRYNMHYLPQSLLIEVGAQTNTLEEAMNAMEPLAAVLDYVLSGNQE